ncbi:MAG: glycosyltransferase family 2 protein [Leptolyngbyaceae bacterium]|nr:glycosyltransferase family 2 protein [Leptolyngbyaceae bacterium]
MAVYRRIIQLLLTSFFMTDLLISAIICTHNRDHYLGDAIDSLLSQQFDGEFEVIVVDNASSDRTRDVVDARQPHPRLNYVYEAVTGLSVARNTGAQMARGQILAYLDDDAIASPHWLQVLWNHYEQSEETAIAGGRIDLIWPSTMHQQPKWMTPELSGNLGFYDLGDEVTFIENPGQTPRGLNYSMRRSFWEAVGGFDSHLGRVGKRLLSNEELQMTERAIEAGWRVAYLPDALVSHTVAPERLHPAWFLNRSWWQGISEYYREQLAGRHGIVQLQRGAERLLRGLYRSVKHMGDPALRFDNFVYAYGQIGYLLASLKGLLIKPS